MLFNLKLVAMSFITYYFILSCMLVDFMCLTVDSQSTLPFIKKYDNVRYDSSMVHDNHLRIVRSLDSYLYINFNSFNRTFRLKLKPMKSLFNHNNIEIGSKSVPLNEHLFYNGYLIDEPNSSASGSVIDGVFYGTIKTVNGFYYIEPTRKYIKNNIKNKSESIIYHENDIDFDDNRINKKRSLNKKHIGCASEDVFKWMRKVQKSAYEENLKRKGFEFYYSHMDHSNWNKNKNKHSKVPIKNNRKSKRNIVRLEFPNKRSVCSLYMRVDPVLYKEIYRSEGIENHDKTLMYVMSYLHQHVEAINNIFSRTKWFNDDNEYYVGLKFAIYRTRVITHEMCKKENIGQLSVEERYLCLPDITSLDFLGNVALDDYSKFCLSYTLTARDFADGVLGYAWVAKPGFNAGGVCEERIKWNDQYNSLNCGIVSLVNYQSRVADIVSQLTLAHEIGHNLGAEHDDIDECSPGDKNGGDYIMFKTAVSGNKPNNHNFSKCSIESISKVLFSLVNSPKFCFKVDKGPICGNSIIEEGEECDCGFKNECKELCCHPADSEFACKRLQGATCSPSEGPCCDANCQYSSRYRSCLKANECSKEIFCNGSSPFCPSKDPKYFINTDDKGHLKECNDGTQVCHNGVCSGSICEKYNMKQCYLQGDLYNKNANKGHLCHLACIGELTNKTCKDSHEIKELHNEKRNKTGFILKTGSLCLDTNGYCDLNAQCRPIVAYGSLSRFTNRNLSAKSFLVTVFLLLLISILKAILIVSYRSRTLISEFFLNIYYKFKKKSFKNQLDLNIDT